MIEFAVAQQMKLQDMLHNLVARLEREEGQDMIEYALLAAADLDRRNRHHYLDWSVPCEPVPGRRQRPRHDLNRRGQHASEVPVEPALRLSHCDSERWEEAPVEV